MKSSEILKKLLKDVEKHKIGDVDYYWDGKKVVRDKISFNRQELLDWFAKNKNSE